MNSTMNSTTVESFRLGPYIAVRVEAAESNEIECRALHIGFLLDVSYSMAGERLDAVKRTLAALTPLFKPTDFCTIVSFSGAARTVVSRLPMDAAGLTEFQRATTAMAVEGNTNLGEGITHMAALHTDYDAIILLTDGQITAGVQSDEGIQSLLTGFRGRPLHTLGYGADHNRSLLNHVALTSCGTYTFVDGETTLPISMADLLQGLRSEVLHEAVLTVEGTTCIELNGAGPVRRIGGVVPGRPYWSVFQGPHGPATITLNSVEQTIVVPAMMEDVTGDALDMVKEQITRARVVSLLAQGTAVLETGSRLGGVLDVQIQGLLDEIGESTRPLLLRMKGQLIDMRCYLRALPPPPVAGEPVGRSDAWGPPPPSASASIMARMTSVTGVLSSQRGVTSYHAGDDPDQTFSSPAQRSASHQVSAHYSGADPE